MTEILDDQEAERQSMQRPTFRGSQPDSDIQGPESGDQS